MCEGNAGAGIGVAELHDAAAPAGKSKSPVQTSIYNASITFRAPIGIPVACSVPTPWSLQLRRRPDRKADQDMFFSPIRAFFCPQSRVDAF